jgi:TRAP-type C4-dicarboxylate transport system permease small subunit
LRLLTAPVRWLAGLAGALASVATVTCLGLVGWSVFARYVLGAPQPWVDKVAGWLVVALVLLAAPEAQRRFEHIGVDVALSRMPAWLARVFHLIGVLSVAAVGVILFLAGVEAIEFSRLVGLMTDLPGVPVWWVQTLLPVGAALLVLVALAQAAVLATGGEPEHLPRGGEELLRDTLARGE